MPLNLKKWFFYLLIEAKFQNGRVLFHFEFLFSCEVKHNVPNYLLDSIET